MKYYKIIILLALCQLAVSQLDAQCDIGLEATSTPVKCPGETNGSIDLSVSGGTEPYTYAWSNGENSEDLDNLGAGIYIVSVTDALGCFATLTKNLVAPVALHDTITEKCFLDYPYAPTLTCTASGGSLPYAYTWSTGQQSAAIQVGLLISTYSVTVTDARGCTSSSQYTAGYPESKAGVNQNVNCAASSATLNGASSLFKPGTEFTWTGFDGGQVLSGANSLSAIAATAGTYRLTLFDPTTQCTSIDEMQLYFNVGRPVINIQDYHEVINCIDTVAVLGASGGSAGPITIEWLTTNGHIVSGGNTMFPTVDQAGTYTLLVTDTQNGCTVSDDVTVVEDKDSRVIVAHPTQFGIPCGGGSVSFVMSVFAGTTFYWSGPNGWSSFEQNPIVNQPGIYVLHTTGDNGCVFADEFEIYPGPVINTTDFAVSNLPCTVGALGAVNLSPNFGTPPYTYLWSNGAVTEDLNNLSAGTYSVVVTDATACDYYGKVTVTQSTALNLQTVATQLNCFGENTGSINLTATLGASPYTYNWTGPQGYTVNVEDPSGLAAGAYAVTVTDAGGCTNTTTVAISSPEALVVPINNVVLTNPACLGSADGTIVIAPQGGTPPYAYDWSNDGPDDPDNDTRDLSGVGAGAFTVTVTDANGCTVSPGSYSLLEPAALQLDATVNTVPCGGAGTEGAIDLTATGGVAPFSYAWSNGASTEDINTLNAGTYSVTVTQSNGCTTTYTATIFEGSTLLDGDFTVVPASCPFGAADGSITVNSTPAGAQAPLSFLWEGANAFTSAAQNITALAAGNYNLTITDATGCQYISVVEVEKIPGNISVSLNEGAATCEHGTVDLNVSGGSAPFVYQWSNGANTEELLYTSAGIYTVTVTDNTGCSVTASITLTNNIGLSLTADVVDVVCFAGNDGAVNLTVANGSNDYTYLWSNNTTTQNLSGIPAGIYCVTVTDSGSGCTVETCVLLKTPPTFSAATVSTTGITCWGGADGTASFNIQSSGGGSFSWNLAGPTTQAGSTVTNSFDIEDLAAGQYTLIVTNPDGCTTEVSFALSSPAPVVPGIEILSNTCNAAVIRAHVAGGDAPFSYTWESVIPLTDTSATIVAPVSGLYQVFVTDSKGCQGTGSLDLALANGGNCGYVRGSVVLDNNENCVVNLNEPGLNGWLVRAEGLDTLYGVTDANGNYLIGVPTGDYTMAVLPPNNLWLVCPTANQADVTMPNDTAFGGDFPVQKIKQCPALSISIGVAQLRRCFSNNTYVLTYCNEGTLAAENAYVDVTLDPLLSFAGASLPVQDMGNNVIRVLVGHVDIGECGTFSVRVLVSCGAVLGQTHCTEAHIYPDTLCRTNDLWSGASLDVRGLCGNDSMRFVVKNTGYGNMAGMLDYIVVEDAVMRMKAPLPPLQSGDSILVAFPANGSTWRVQVDQEPYHPFPDPVGLSVEGCTTNGSFSTGYINQFSQKDAPPTVDIDCTANIGSYDPNDKQGFPIGFGQEHYIRPGTEIEYLIRFQNTGTDTAFTVHVVDTLSSWLDPASIKFGVSSHPCRFDLTGEGIAHFYFDNIALPDSNVNEAASHGFAKFTIKPHLDVPLESLIENTAAIYFDFNEAVLTNTTYHRLGENFLTVGIWQPFVPTVRVIATPNPFLDETVLEVKGMMDGDPLQLQVYDYQGVEVRKVESSDGIFRLRKGNWPAGVYFFKIMQNGKIVGNGKLFAQ